MRRTTGKRKSTRPGMDAAGMTLMELMVSIAVGIIILTGIVSIYWTQTQMNRRENLTLKLQQSSRGAVDLLSREMRLVGFDAETKGTTFRIVNIGRDPHDNSILEFTADIGGGGNALNGTLEDNEYIRYSLYKSTLTGPVQEDDPNGGDTDLGRRAGIDGSNVLLAPGVEALSFAYAFDLDGDGNLDRGSTASEEGILWATDTDSDNVLDSVVDSNLDGIVDFRDNVAPLASLNGPTSVEMDSIRAIKVWILFRTQYKRRELPDVHQSSYYVGHLDISTTDGHHDPYYDRMLFTFTTDLRNMGLQHD